jgi:putative nucleotidyltransferase with HDIG domain
MALALDPDVSVYRISRLVALEQGLATRVLRLANSASCAPLKQITTINQAIVRVGTDAVRHSILAACVAERIEASARFVKCRDLFDHAIGTAILAQLTAEQSGVDPEESLVAGLLHDIGKLVILSLGREARQFGGPPALDGETEFFTPGHHAVVGSQLLREWRIPDALREPVLYHHRPSSSGRFAPVTRVVYAANRLSHRYGFGCKADPDVDILGDAAVIDLELDEDWLTDLDLRAHRVIAGARRLMG